MLVLVAFALLYGRPADVSPTDVRGCLIGARVVERTARLVERDWRHLTPGLLGRESPERLKVIGRTAAGTPVLFARVGLDLDGQLRCGETYAFASPSTLATDPEVGLQLEEVSVVHSERGGDQALGIAKALIHAIGPPASATRTDSVTVDGTSPKDPLFHADYGWTRDATQQRESLVVDVIRENDLYVISANWRRRAK